MYDIPTKVLDRAPPKCYISGVSSNGSFAEHVYIEFDKQKVVLKINTFGDVAVHSAPEYFKIDVKPQDTIEGVIFKVFDLIPAYREYLDFVAKVMMYWDQKRDWVSDLIYKNNPKERPALMNVASIVAYDLMVGEQLEPWYFYYLRKIKVVEKYYIARVVWVDGIVVLEGLTSYPTKAIRDDTLRRLLEIKKFRLANTKT